MPAAMIKVLVAGLLGTIAGVAVMIVVIVASGTTTSGATSVGLGPLSTPTAGSSTPASQPPPSSGGSSTPTSSGGSGQGDAANGKTIFTGSAGCGSCHTLAAAGTSGTIGPNLDSLAADAQKAGMPLDAFIKDSIVNPSAYIASGFSDGVMPATFGSSLSASDIADLVAFISASQK